MVRIIEKIVQIFVVKFNPFYGVCMVDFFNPITETVTGSETETEIKCFIIYHVFVNNITEVLCTKVDKCPFYD